MRLNEYQKFFVGNIIRSDNIIRLLLAVQGKLLKKERSASGGWIWEGGNQIDQFKSRIYQSEYVSQAAQMHETL